LGLDTAIEGDTVLVAPGVYFENIVWPHSNGIKLLGSNPESCVIDGGHNGRVILFSEDLDGIVDSTTAVTGFTLQNGTALLMDPYPSGGGIACFNAAPRLSRLVVQHNTAGDFGGGVACYNSELLLIDVKFSGNAAGAGGGGFGCEVSTVVLIDVEMSDNHAANLGGGIYTFLSDVTLSGAKVYHNTASRGGGFNSYGTSLSMESVTCAGNVAFAEGGSMVFNESSVYSTWSVYWGNTQPEFVPGVGSSIIVECSDVAGGWPGDGNIESDPFFCDPGSGDFTLRNDSPCAPANNDCGVLMGAWPVGCSTSAGSTTWSQIKRRF